MPAPEEIPSAPPTGETVTIRDEVSTYRGEGKGFI